MNRCQHPSSTSRRLWRMAPLIVAVVSSAAGVAIVTWKPRPSQDAILATDRSTPVEKVQMYDSAYAKACQEANGVVVVRFPNPNGLECTPAEAIQPLGPEVQQPR